MDDLDLASNTLPTLPSLKRSMQQYRREMRLLWWTQPIAYVATFLTFLAADRYLGLTISSDMAEPIGSVVLIVFGCLLGIPLGRAVDKRRKSLAALFSTPDVRLTPLLCEFLLEPLEAESCFYDQRNLYNKRDLEEICLQTRTALMRLLPELRQEHVSLFGNRPRALWRRFLNHVPANVKDTELTILLLKALETLGDDQDLEVVERIADGRTARSWPVKQAAIACATGLKDRQEQQRARRSLLRPADGGAIVEQTLLRPSQSHAVSIPQQLLRASDLSAGRASDHSL